MGSVIDYIECPRCKNDNCTDDFYYKTGEEYIFCSDCGYHKVFHYKRDENGELMKKDENRGGEFDNLITEEIIIDNPFGAYRISWKNGVGSVGVLVNEDEYNQFIVDIKNADNKVEISKVTISRLVEDKIVREIIYGELEN